MTGRKFPETLRVNSFFGQVPTLPISFTWRVFEKRTCVYGAVFRPLNYKETQTNSMIPMQTQQQKKSKTKGSDVLKETATN